MSGSIVYFDIAAAVILCFTTASLFIRRLTRGAANRVYLTTSVLITITAIAAVGAETIVPDPLQDTIPFANPNQTARYGFTVLYYTLHAFLAPAYLILIATVSDTPHRMNSNAIVRIFLWIPMIAVALLAVTNPLHNLMFYYDGGYIFRGPLYQVLYIEAAYYSVIGFAWLIRWRYLMTTMEFGTLLLLYPGMIFSIVIQYLVPGLRLEMFASSIALLLVSAFAIHPETRIDPNTGAESHQAFRNMIEHAYVTNRRLCLVFVQIINMEKLRELAGNERVHEIVALMAEKLMHRLRRDDVMYYLRDGLFCISPRDLDQINALSIAMQAHLEGKAESEKQGSKSTSIMMRSCVVRVPEDAPDPDTLKTFMRRYEHLVPTSTVTSFEELSKKEDFGLQMALTNILERAITERSFQVYYQPIMCLDDMRFHSAEALVRLRDKEFGWVSPGLFIPEAEQNGMIIEIGSILLEKICAFLGTVDFEGTGLHYVEANLSVDQCIQDDLADEVLGLVKKHSIEAHCLNLEITETSSVYSQMAIEENVRKLAAAGLTLSLDDYGTGYSNVARMLDIPFSLIKFDKSFVDALGDSTTRIVFAESVSMIKEIGKHALVEGVETAGQFEVLKAMGVDYIQGYYFAKPMPENDFIAFLMEHNQK